MPKEQMTRIKAIKAFFEAEGGRKVTMDELKALPKEDRIELADLIAEQLGVEIVETK